MSLFEKRSGSPFPEPIVPAFPGWSPFGGASVNIDQSLRVNAVWACVRLLSDAVSMMPVCAYDVRKGQRVPVDNPPLLDMPAAQTSMADWIYQVMVSALLNGNAYGEIVTMDDNGSPTQIELQHPDRVHVGMADGRPEYTFNGRKIDPGRVWHFRAFRMPGLSLGLSPIAYAARTISTSALAADFGRGFFADGAHPTGIFSTAAPINQTQAKEIKDRLNEAVRGREALVLGNGANYAQLQVSPTDSQFLDTMRWDATQIATVFGVPPHMIGAPSGSSMTYQSVEMESLNFLTYSVQPWLTRLENALFPLLPRKKHVRFNPDVLLRTDLETRIRAGAQAIASKQMTPTEVRAWEGNDLPPLTEEQKTELGLVPLTVSATGQPQAVPTPPAEEAK